MCDICMAKSKKRSVGMVQRKVNVDLVNLGVRSAEAAVGFGLSNVISARILTAVGQTGASSIMLSAIKFLLAFATVWAGSSMGKKYQGDFAAFAAGMGMSAALDILKRYLPASAQTALGLNTVSGVNFLRVPTGSNAIVRNNRGVRVPVSSGLAAA